MTIHESISFAISPGLQEEIDHLSSEPQVIYHSNEELREATQNTLYAATVKKLLSYLPLKSHVVDIGCGFGETSLMLAQAGHTVHSIEPAPSRCKALATSLNHLKLDGQTYVCTAEDLDKVPLQNLNGALFYSSLHHCDDPLLALKKARNTLSSFGVIVICEPILRFYRTKKWFHKQLKEHSVKMGHYGGNEHIYYFHEYRKMLSEAGFAQIECHWANIEVDPRLTLISDLNKTLQGQTQHSVMRCFIKYLIHRVVQRMCRHKWLDKLCIKPLLKISLLQTTFVARALSK